MIINWYGEVGKNDVYLTCLKECPDTESDPVIDYVITIAVINKLNILIIIANHCGINGILSLIYKLKNTKYTVLNLDCFYL